MEWCRFVKIPVNVLRVSAASLRDPRAPNSALEAGADEQADPAGMHSKRL